MFHWYMSQLISLLDSFALSHFNHYRSPHALLHLRPSHSLSLPHPFLHIFGMNMDQVLSLSHLLLPLLIYCIQPIATALFSSGHPIIYPLSFPTLLSFFPSMHWCTFFCCLESLSLSFFPFIFPSAPLLPFLPYSLCWLVCHLLLFLIPLLDPFFCLPFFSSSL